MLRFSPLTLPILLCGCLAQQEVDVADGVWHENESLAQFTDTWSVCHHFRAITSDEKWLIDVDVSSERGMFDAGEMVSLVDFSDVTDRECAISLYRNNDIACEGREPITTPAAHGDGSIRHTKRTPDWESTFDLHIYDLTFQVGENEILIDRVKFSDVEYSNFCPG